MLEMKVGPNGPCHYGAGESDSKCCAGAEVAAHKRRTIPGAMPYSNVARLLGLLALCGVLPAGGCKSSSRDEPMQQRAPYTTANPVLYSNDHPEDVHTDVLMMAMQSNGTIDLRGIITDQQQQAPADCAGDGCHTVASDDELRRQWIEAARASGFRDVPDSVVGEQAIELIVAEAKKAKRELPLVLIVGGPLTLVARAYERDPSIAETSLVSLAAFQMNSAWTDNKYRPETNITGDAEAARVVLEKMRCVIIPFSDFNAEHIDEKRYPATPLARVSKLPDTPLRRRMQSIYAYPWAHYDADGGPSAILLSTGYAVESRRVRWATDDGGPYLANDPSSDDILVTAVDGGKTTEPWWREVNRAFGSP
jgi:hypothetical protein